VNPEVVIIGAGPAGLTAAYELSKQGVGTTIIEKDASEVGGISRTVKYKGYRFDIGGHRFFTKIPEVNEIWQEILSDQFITRPRLSRIFYRGKFFSYPLKPFEALKNIGVVDSTAVGFSYLWAKAFPSKEEVNFEQWVSNRFGQRLYSMFFKTYTEKVWGMPCTELGADWAAQRIQNLSLFTALKNAFFGKKGDTSVKTLIDQFEYPRLGPGQMWEKCRDIVRERGHVLHFGRGVKHVHHASGKVTGVTTVDGDGNEERIDCNQVISSMPLSQLVRVLEPAPPTEVLAAADALRYRDFLTISLVVDQEELFPDNWIYIHSPDVQMGRIQNFKNWSPDMVPDAKKTCLGLEYFVFEGNELWNSPNEQLVELGGREVEKLGLASKKDVEDGTVVRMPKAYPVYDSAFQAALDKIQSWMSATLPTIQPVGRNGQHRYNNQDHSMLTSILAVKNVLGEQHDIWNVNVDGEYHETVERQVPRRVSDSPSPAVSGR